MRVLGLSGLDGNVEFKKRRFPGLSAREYRILQGFDSAAALVTDQGIEAAAAEERFSRVKGTGDFPRDAIAYCLQAGGVGLADVDHVAHAFDYAAVKTYFDHDDHSRAVYGELYAPEAQRQALTRSLPGGADVKSFVPVTHHVAHAASAFYPSGFDEALVLVTDGMGEIHSASAFVGSNDGLEPVMTIPSLHSLGILYGVFTLHLGFFMGLDEYKVMGLAPYGDARRYYDDVMQFVKLQGDGTYTVPLLAENRTVLDKETHRGALGRLEEVFGPGRDMEGELTQHHRDVAAALQAVLQTCQLHVLRALKRKTKQRKLCLAGGVALNCTANGVVRRSHMFDDMFVQPAAGDDGSALGAALHVYHREMGSARPRSQSLPLWGPEFNIASLREAVADPDLHVTELSEEELVEAVARKVVDGEIVAWFQGRMEFGPRALGSRSILADPRQPDMRDRVNALIKKREGFRPFAPAVVAEAASKYFEIDAGDEAAFAHMLYVVPVREAYRSELPAITHVDGSARVQSVVRDDNPLFYHLLEAFGRLSGMPILLNTSFNVRGQPIVCTPQEAVQTFCDANLDALAIGNFLVSRRVGSEPVRDQHQVARAGM